MVIATSYKVCLETGVAFICSYLHYKLWYILVVMSWCVLVLIEFSHYFSFSGF